VNLAFHPAATAELARTAAWYELCRAGFGDVFMRAVETAVALALERPWAAPAWPGCADIRVRRVARFPHQLPYVVEERHIRVLAIAHTRQRPGYWVDRL
jgi:toxin ParE1/3/4